MALVRAPELPQHFPWLNCDRPLSLQSLRGRIVILDFWTLGCINCLHILPDLNYLEETYSDCVTVIGVHSAKFDYEKELETIQNAIWRHQISHPVVVDNHHDIWQHYTIRAWPTVVVIDPTGYIAGSVSGEGKRVVLEELVQQLKKQQSKMGEWNVEQPQRSLNLLQSEPTPLSFPGQVAADADRDLLFIADTGHHRIVVTSLNGTVKHLIGTGQPGWVDGDAIAQFSQPQGLAYDPQQQRLWVTELGNHTIRQVDVLPQRVSTCAGTGNQSRTIFPHGGKALETALNSPWAIVQRDRWLYIAMAGSHQIWVMDWVNQTVQTLIGTGAEFCVDGEPQQAAFAQPSGITTNGQELFVADSETSTIRAVSLTDPPIARTVCGSGQLFGFGDRDGIGSDVRLQHCTGTVYAEGALWVSDTYNHKIKRVHPITGRCETVAGSGSAGYCDGTGQTAQFSEPSGIAYARGCLYVADSSNHAIRRIDLSSFIVQTMHFPGLCSPTACFPS